MSVESKFLCQFTGPLPAKGERADCAACGRSCDSSMIRRCQVRGPNPTFMAAVKPQPVPPCEHLGEIIHHEPCSCGANKTVAVHRCQASETSGHANCIPLTREWAKLIGPDEQRVIPSCQNCPARSIAGEGIKGHGLAETPLGYHYSIPPVPSTGMESRDPVDWFERVVCISLERRPDRWSQFMDHIEMCDWPFKAPERFRAIDGAKVPPPHGWNAGPGAWGCARSHLRLLEDVLSSGAESVLIMEDDSQPMSDIGSRVKRWQRGLPDNWQGLWLGGEHVGRSKALSTRVSDTTLKCRYVTRTHCYGLRQPFLGQFYKYLADHKTSAENKTDHIDHAIARFMRGGLHALYAPTDWLVAQAATTSDIFHRPEPRRMFK